MVHGREDSRGIEEVGVKIMTTKKSLKHLDVTNEGEVRKLSVGL